MKQNIKGGPITTILGVLLVLFALTLFGMPYFYEYETEPNMLVPAGLCAGGLVLILSPDTLLGIIKKKTGADANQ